MQQNIEKKANELPDVACIQIEYDQSIKETYRIQNYIFVEYLILVMSQLSFIYIIFSFFNSFVIDQSIIKEINEKLIAPQETEQKLLLKLANKAKEIVQKRKCDGRQFQVPVYDKKQEILLGVDENFLSLKDKKDVISMNTDNFFQFDINNQQNKSHEILYTNNISFVPNYFNFELQQVLGRPYRSSRYSLVNNELLANNIKKKSVYELNQLQPLNQQQLQQQKQNIQSYHNLLQINRKSSASMIKLQQQSINSPLIQQPRETITVAAPARNSLVPLPSLSHMNSQNQLMDLSLHLNKENNMNTTKQDFHNISDGGITNTIISPQNGDLKGAIQKALLRKDLDQINDGDNFTPLISEKDKVPISSHRQSQTNLVKIDLKPIQKKEFFSNDDIHIYETENENSFFNIHNNPNGGFQSIRSKGQSFFGVDRKQSLKKKPSQHQSFNPMFPQMGHQFNSANLINNRAPFINLNNVQQENNINNPNVNNVNILNTNTINNNSNNNNNNNNNNFNFNNNSNININNNNNLNININHNISNLNQPPPPPLNSQPRGSKIKFESRSQIQQLEKVIEDTEKDPEISTKKRLSLNEINFSYFSFLEDEKNLQGHKQIQYPVLNDLNILKVLDKLIELDRLKNILLNPCQLAVFEYIIQSPIGKQEYLNNFLNNQTQQTQQQRLGSFNTTSSSKDQMFSSEEKIIKGWKAMRQIERLQSKSDIDQRLIENINQNIYYLVNLSNIEEIFQQGDENKNNGNDLNSNQIINLNKLQESQSITYTTRARGQADAIKQRNQRSLSESSCNKIVADENFNF